MARGLGSQRRLLSVGWFESADAARKLDARSSRARLAFWRPLRALGGGYGDDDSLALGASTVASVCLR